LKKKRFLLLFLVPVLGLLVFSTPILKGLGRFMAPQGESRADTVVVEGDQVVREGAVRAGVALIKENRAKQLILVLHRYSEKERLFAIQDQYPDRLGKELDQRGLKKGQYRIWVAPINGYPVTLTEARYVVIEVYLLDAADGPGDKEDVSLSVASEAGVNGHLVVEGAAPSNIDKR
jgi:hypothetical protein